MDPELDAMSKILAALHPLDADGRERVLLWVSDKLGVSRHAKPAAGPNQPISAADSDLESPLEHGALPARATLWMKQNDVSLDEVSETFHIADGEAQLIISEIPGRNNKERVLNAYVLAGLSQLLISGEATFTDSFARDMCVKGGCFDTTNHSKYLAGRGNELAGSKDRGWMLTSPGLKKAAVIIKANSSTD